MNNNIPEEYVYINVNNKRCIEINNIVWWTKKIKGFELLSKEERIKFIDDHHSYYLYCQDILYKGEDPYYLKYKNLPTFLFFSYLDTDIDICEWFYNNKYKNDIILTYLDEVVRYKVIKNGYLPSIKFLISNGLIPKNLSYLTYSCSYGHLEMVKYMFDVFDLNTSNIEYTYIECYRLALLGGHIHIFKWLYYDMGISLKSSSIDYFIGELKKRNKTDLVEFLNSLF